MTDTKTYTKTELDEAVKKAVEGTIARFEKKAEKLIDEKDYKDLQEKYNNLSKELTDIQIKPSIKDAFVKAGGNEKAFDDFYKSYESKLVGLKNEGLTTFIGETKKEKEYMFGGEVEADTANNLSTNKEAPKTEKTNDSFTEKNGAFKF